MNTIITFDEVLKQTKPEKRFLLLGNGFSMSYDFNRFSFTSLLDSAIKEEIIIENSPIHKMFVNLETADFEYIMRLLEDTSKTISCYSNDECSEKIKNKLIADTHNLKQYLVDIITNNHPEKITVIDDFKFTNTMNFISNFKKIYTLNYDLLLYWTTIKLKEREKKDIFKDGFGLSTNNEYEIVYKNKKDNNGQNVFYLHGALHLFDNKTDFLKITYKETYPLKDQILEKLNKNIYPIFISEGTAENKRNKIIHNALLSSAYKSLQTSGSKDSSLILFGTILKSNDEHIKQAIMDNGINKIYIGVNPKNQEELDHIKNNFNSDKKEIILYNYRSVKLW